MTKPGTLGAVRRRLVDGARVARPRAAADAARAWAASGTPGPAAPRIEVRTGPWLPGAAVRLVPAGLVAVTAELVDAGSGTGLVLAALAAVVALRPALPVAGGVVLVVGLAVFAGPDLLVPPGTSGGVRPDAGVADPAGPPRWLGPLRLGLVVLCLDATVRIAGLVPHVAWRARVEWSVLARLGRTSLRTQALVQPVLWLAVGLRAVSPGGAGGESLRVVALVAVVVLVLLLVPRRTRAHPP